MGIFVGNDRISVYRKIKGNKTKVRAARSTLNGHLASLEKRIESYEKDPLKNIRKGPVLSMMDAIAKEIDALFVTLGFKEEWIEFVKKESKKGLFK